MSYFDRGYYNRNNIIRYGSKEDAASMTGFDWAVNAVECEFDAEIEFSDDDSVIGRMKREIIEEFRDRLLRSLECTAVEMMCAILDGTDGEDLEPVPEDDRLERMPGV